MTIRPAFASFAPRALRAAPALSLAAMLAACGSTPNAGLDGGALPSPDAEAPALDAQVDADASTPPDTDGGTPSDCPEAANFLDVSGGSAGAAYPAPTLRAYCEGDFVVVESNGIIGYEFVAITPNPLTAQTYRWQIPRHPTAAASTTSVPLVGPSGVAVNGLPLYGPTEAPMMGSRDPFLDGLLDYCNGHTAPGGVYHYHAPPECLFTDYEGQTHLVVAYANDGYPILAPFECTDAACTSTRELHSSYRQREAVYGTTIQNAWDAHEYVAGLGDLDECNGKTLPSGEYVYYATRTFPYFMGCYRGTPRTQAGGGMMMTGADGGMMMPPPGGDAGMMMPGTPPMCGPGLTMRCCGDAICGGPETHANCAADCP